MTFGENIKALRKLNGWTQQEVADRAGLIRSHIGRIEHNDIKECTFGTLLGLAKAFSVDSREILKIAGIEELCGDCNTGEPLRDLALDIRVFLAVDWPGLNDNEQELLRLAIRTVKQSKDSRKRSSDTSGADG